MSGVDEQFLQTLRATFRVEAAEHLETMGSGLRQMPKATAAEWPLLVEGVFRAAHSLKGAARAVNLAEIEALCQALEDRFAAWKHHETVPTAQALDAAYLALDCIARSMVTSSFETHHEPLAPVSGSAASCPTPSNPAPLPAVHAEPAQHTPALTGESGTVRVALSSLDARLLESEEMLAAKQVTEEWLASAGELTAHFERWRRAWRLVQPRVRTLQQATERTGAVGTDLQALSEFLEWNQEHHRALETRVAALRRGAEQDNLLIGKLVDDLLENSKKLIMLPLATHSALLFKVVRDLCRDQGKEAELTLRGEDITIDKRILEELKDPLIHLLRNCIDHGIEKPEQRRRAGKQARASITVEIAALNSNQVEISVRDDGAGIDVEKVKLAAAKRGLLAPETHAQLEPAAALALVFETDLSTSPMITPLSGRGLGLAIVREKTEKLGGRVAIESARNVGTTIRMTVPLTLATFRGVLFRAARQLFVVPTAQVERATRFRSQDVQTVEGRRTLALDGRTVALVELAEVLRLPSVPRSLGASATTPVLVLTASEQRVAFAIEDVLDEREVLVKRLTRPLLRVRNVAGATILGSGEVVPILNVQDLIKSAKHASGAMRATLTPEEPAAAEGKRILIVEDSITSRMLLKAILESIGHEVRTAVDGIDAFTTLRSEHFDLVVSDVEMPRMNGFDLTTKIRADRNLAELPVVLVTALESREDRERGIDVGANAYLVKSSLDQSNLLEAVRRLA